MSPHGREAATGTGEARSTLGSAPKRGLAALFVRISESPWAKPAAKLGLALLALVVLSAIGGSALAGARFPIPNGETAATFGATGPPLLDAGPAPVAVIALAETVIEVRPSDGDAGTGATPSKAGSASPGSTGKASVENPVTLNTATFEDLRRLPGVGPKKAEAILALRAKLGKFRRAEDLLRVKGIGRGTFKKLKPLVRVDEPAQVAVQ